ncbi:MAG: hypothetical protein Q8P03_00745, partial [bacterium]|nr:hypothetical protein [bacterium]
CDYPSPGTYTARVFVTRQGVSAQDTATISVNQTLVSPPPPAAALTLAVNLTANPSSGTAPLNDVDLTAQVSGTANGEVSYRLDCTNDGSYERVTNTSSTTLVVTDLCDYASPGVYTAKVIVVRAGLSASDTALITVNPPAFSPPPPPPASSPTFSVSLTAIPSFGFAPLNNVDLKADVSGTATGNVNYRFDCTNNGPYEFETTVSATSFTKVDLCDYASPGSYTARVYAVRQGIVAQSTTIITVNQTLTSTPPPPPPAAATLSVILTPIPSSGIAPLNNVDMKADVSGTATGTIDYRFDCTNNGPYEFETIISSTTLTKADLCDYPTPGTYTARVFARRGGITAQDTAIIVVSAAPATPPASPPPTLSVTLIPVPSSGIAPLNNVDMAAEVSGTATGAITYKFDCTNDGVFESSDIVTTSTFTKMDICDYSVPGLYVARVWAARGGISAEDTAFVAVGAASSPPPAPTPTPTPTPTGAGPNLTVDLFANPDNGAAPLKGVDLNASVGGSAVGNITYFFDCTNDGTIERTVTTSATVFNAIDLCSYPLGGMHTASVRVERSGLNAQNIDFVTVTAPAFALNIAAVGQNLTEGDTSWNDPVFAKPADKVAFQVFVSSESSQIIHSVMLRSILPSKIGFVGDVRVDGLLVAGNPIIGIPLGSMQPGQTKTITFESQVQGESQFAVGLEDLVASFVASNPDQSVTDTVTVQVIKKGVLGATQVPTGFLSNMLFALVGTIVILFLAWFSYFVRFYLRNHSLMYAFKSRAEIDLAHVVAKIRRRERI